MAGVGRQTEFPANTRRPSNRTGQWLAFLGFADRGRCPRLVCLHAVGVAGRRACGGVDRDVFGGVDRRALYVTFWLANGPPAYQPRASPADCDDPKDDSRPGGAGGNSGARLQYGCATGGGPLPVPRAPLGRADIWALADRGRCPRLVCRRAVGASFWLADGPPGYQPRALALGPSIPKISFVVLELIPPEERPEFVLKCLHPMMLLLLFDVPANFVHGGLAN